MPLETGTYIPDLVVSNPAHADGLNQGDGHIRLIKNVLQNTFPHFTDVALNSSQSALDATVNVLTGVSGQGLFPSGTAALPSISFAGDADTGIFRGGEGDIEFSIDGVDVFGINSTHLNSAIPINATKFTGGSGELVPPGALLMYQGGSPPTGWAWANGGTVPAASNPTLASIYGSSGGNVTLPDWRCVVPVGQDNMGSAGFTGRINASGVNANIGNMAFFVGESTHTLTIAELAAHAHTDAGHSHTDSGHSHSTGNGQSFFTVGGSGTGIAVNQFGVVFSSIGSTASAAANIQQGFANIQNTGNGAGHNNVQLSVVTGFIIKLG